MLESWEQFLSREKTKDYFVHLTAFLNEEARAGFDIFPPNEQVFDAFRVTPFEKVKVVILGQDPYPQPGQAMGLSFSVPDSVRVPRSLVNIFKEMRRDLHSPEAQGLPESGSLLHLSQQGVLLLNSILTVRKGQAGSHRKKGWETFTDAVIDRLNEGREHLVFMLWGKYAQEKGARIDRKRHLVLEAGHPSPLAIGSTFHGCSHFTKCNRYLEAHGVQPIQWLHTPEKFQLPNLTHRVRKG